MSNWPVESFLVTPSKEKSKQEKIEIVETIKPVNIKVADFRISGTAPLVIHRFSAKTKQEMKQKMETGKSASSKKDRKEKLTDDTYFEARYISSEGWDGFQAGSIRKAMISACRLVNFKMTLAKMSIFVIQDGWDELEPQIPLIRIFGEPQKQEDMARTSTNMPYVTVRAAYHNWKEMSELNLMLINSAVTILQTC